MWYPAHRQCQLARDLYITRKSSTTIYTSTPAYNQYHIARWKILGLKHLSGYATVYCCFWNNSNEEISLYVCCTARNSSTIIHCSRLRYFQQSYPLYVYDCILKNCWNFIVSDDEKVLYDTENLFCYVHFIYSNRYYMVHTSMHLVRLICILFYQS